MRLVVENLSKEYRGEGQVVQALSKVQLALRPGVLGLLGPNGAGKSTLMRILATITQPSSGRVLWNDVEIAHHPDPLRTVLGYLPQDFGVYPDLDALEFLEYLAAVKGIQTAAARKRIGELLELVNLTEVAKRPLGGYSGGMRQRIGIAQALLNDPQLVIVDEPTASLDPEERVRFRNLLSELSGERIVILSTHIVSDVEAVASSIAILAHGHLIAHDVPEALLASVAGKVWQVVVPSSELYALRQKHLVSSTAHRSDGVHARVVADAAPEDPTFALSLGVWSGTREPFEIYYTLLWYVGPLHAVPQLDFMASAPATAASRYTLFYLVLTCILAVVALTGRKRQLKS